MFEKPINKTQVEIDCALGFLKAFKRLFKTVIVLSKLIFHQEFMCIWELLESRLIDIEEEQLSFGSKTKLLMIAKFLTGIYWNSRQVSYHNTDERKRETNSNIRTY